MVDSPLVASELLRRRSIIDHRKIFLSKVGIYDVQHTHHVQHIHRSQEESKNEMQQSQKALQSTQGIRYIWAMFVLWCKKKSKWHKKKTYQRVIYLFLTPITLVFSLTIPPAKDKYWNRIMASLYPICSPLIILLATNGITRKIEIDLN